MALRTRSLADPALVAGSLAALLGLAVMLGWHFKISALVSLRDGLAPMQYITAICLVTAGAGQIALALRFDRGVLAAAALLALISGTTVLAYVGGFGYSPFDCCTGIWPEFSVQRVATPGRMAPNTAVSFLLIAGSLMTAVCWPRSNLPLVLALAVFSVALMSLIGYASGSDTAYRWAQAAIGMAVHTAAGLLALSLGMVLRRGPVLGDAGKFSSSELRRRLLIQLGVGILMPAVAVAVLGLLPMVGELNHAREGEVEHLLQRQASALDAQLGHARALARQVASRQVAYETLWELHESGIDAEAARALMRHNLKDALDAEPLIAGIRMYGADGAALAEVGVPAERVALPPEFGQTREDGLGLLQQIGAEWLLPVIRAVPDRSGSGRAGYAVLLLRTDNLRAALLGPTPNLSASPMILQMPGVEGPVFMDSNGVLAAHDHARPAETHLDLSLALAAEGWILRWHPERDQVFAANRDLLFLTAAGIAVFLAVAMASLLRSLSPLAGHIFLRADILERQVEQTREALVRAEKESAQRLAAERQQHHSDLRYRALVEATQTAVWFTDAQGAISQPMPSWARFTGQSWEEYRGFGAFDAVHPDDVDRLKREWAVAVNTGQFSSNYRLRHVDGSYHHVQSRGISLKDDQGRIYEWIGSVQDIQALMDAETELRKLNTELEQRVQLRTQQLERSNRELQHFAYAASHDLKSPLRSIGSYAGLLMRRYGAALPEGAREIIEAVRDAARQGQQLVEDLLALAKIDADLSPRPEPVDLNQLMHAISETLYAEREDRHAEIRWGQLPTVRGDVSEIARLLQNLVSNGLKFQPWPAPAGHVPQVEVEAWRTETGWCIGVRDNGIGIAPERQQQVFQMFKRLHPQDVYPGSGLGLAICRKIVERHGGRLWMESSPGQGSRFLFSLPDAEGDARARDGRN